jgi:hypothetical protein
VKRSVAIHRVACLASMLVLAVLAGCATRRPPTKLTDFLSQEELERAVTPSNHRRWEPYLAVLPYAELQGQQLTVRNIRNCEYLSENDYIVRHYDKTFDLNRLESVDFLVVPFKEAPSLAHTMLSFGFGENDYLVVSVEARLEEGQSYSTVKGLMRQYELMYVVADERDVIPLRTKHRDVDVYLYPTRTTPEQARMLLLDMMARANKLAFEPEFYDTFTNNCTTNIVNHINRIAPGKIAPSVGVLLPGLSDRLAYDLGLLDTTDTFERTKQRALINRRANRYVAATDFSEKIRRH